MTNHSISTLNYLLTDAPIALEPLRILDVRAFRWREWQVTCHVLGASHAITLQRADFYLTELLACVDWKREASALLTRRADQEWQACVETVGLTCRVNLTLCSLYPEINLMTAFSPESQLTVAYPALPDTSPPVTSIGWQIEADRLTIETLHTYPEEDRAVRTGTVFTVTL